MATYAIGDIQGCYDEFAELLELVAFDSAVDRLWLVGDLVNRGPGSLEVIRLVRSLGSAALSVLGNHDLHLLAIRYGGHKMKSGDTFDSLVNLKDGEEIFEWLRCLPLLVDDKDIGYAMTHAGIPHIWDLDTARCRAREVEAVLRGEQYSEFFAAMYGNRPDRWDDGLRGMDRWRVIINYFTRMRVVDETGRMNFSQKGGLESVPEGWYPWYQLRARNPLPVKILFGHWAALDGITGEPGVIALDTGCVWGRRLTAVCLETGKQVSVPARG